MLPLVFDVKNLAPSQLPARDITIQAGRPDFYRQQFASYGLNFDLLPNYPDKLVNPRSQVMSIGAEVMLKSSVVRLPLALIRWKTVMLTAPFGTEKVLVNVPQTVPVELAVPMK